MCLRRVRIPPHAHLAMPSGKTIFGHFPFLIRNELGHFSRLSFRSQRRKMEPNEKRMSHEIEGSEIFPPTGIWRCMEDNPIQKSIHPHNNKEKNMFHHKSAFRKWFVLAVAILTIITAGPVRAQNPVQTPSRIMSANQALALDEAMSAWVRTR